jgi:hypothetical protein
MGFTAVSYSTAIHMNIPVLRAGGLIFRGNTVKSLYGFDKLHYRKHRAEMENMT